MCTIHHRSGKSSCHPTHGRSDGRCVQRAGTKSARADDSRLLGIPRSRSTITMIYPHHDADYKILPSLSAQCFLIDCIIVARVQPRTSKGITDLLWPHASLGLPPSVPLQRFSSDARYIKSSTSASLTGVGVSLVIGINQTSQLTN